MEENGGEDPIQPKKKRARVGSGTFETPELPSSSSSSSSFTAPITRLSRLTSISPILPSSSSFGGAAVVSSRRRSSFTPRVNVPRKKRSLSDPPPPSQQQPPTSTSAPSNSAAHTNTNPSARPPMPRLLAHVKLESDYTAPSSRGRGRGGRGTSSRPGTGPPSNLKQEPRARGSRTDPTAPPDFSGTPKSEWPSAPSSSSSSSASSSSQSPFILGPPGAGGSVGGRKRKLFLKGKKVSTMEDLDPLNKFRPTSLPFIDPEQREALKKQKAVEEAAAAEAAIKIKKEKESQQQKQQPQGNKRRIKNIYLDEEEDEEAMEEEAAASTGATTLTNTTATKLNEEVKNKLRIQEELHQEEIMREDSNSGGTRGAHGHGASGDRGGAEFFGPIGKLREQNSLCGDNKQLFRASEETRRQEKEEDEDEDEESVLMLMQLPSALPLTPPPMDPEIKEQMEKELKPTSVYPREMEHNSDLVFLNKMTTLPEGYLGKLQVRRSGKVTLKMGDVLFDINPGADCGFLQEVAVISADKGNMYVVGELAKKRVICTPNITNLMQQMRELQVSSSQSEHHSPMTTTTNASTSNSTATTATTASVAQQQQRLTQQNHDVIHI